VPKNDLDHILTTCVGMGVQLLRQYLNDFINTFFLNDGGMFGPKTTGNTIRVSSTGHTAL
jgi:hypothetical protein